MAPAHHGFVDQKSGAQGTGETGQTTQALDWRGNFQCLRGSLDLNSQFLGTTQGTHVLARPLDCRRIPGTVPHLPFRGPLLCAQRSGVCNVPHVEKSSPPSQDHPMTRRHAPCLCIFPQSVGEFPVFSPPVHYCPRRCPFCWEKICWFARGQRGKMQDVGSVS